MREKESKLNDYSPYLLAVYNWDGVHLLQTNKESAGGGGSVIQQGYLLQFLSSFIMDKHMLVSHAWFLGQQLAEHFLDPSYEFSISPVHPLLLEIPGQSAKDYWRLLREHSDARLMQDITNVPGTLRSSTFIQMPSSKFLEQIQDFRKTLALMYRASESNQDKAILMMTNNPLPDINGWQKKDSPMQYLCKKDFQTKKPRDPVKPVCLPSLKSTNNDFTRDENISNLQTMAAGKKCYRFVTEETCNRFKGEFSKRCIERKEQKQRPVSKYTYNPTTCIQLPNINADRNESLCSSITGHKGVKLVCEPLTYTALMDSRPSITVQGKGDFRHGQSTQWLVKRSTINRHSK